jgi:hypothetical protein
MGVDTVFSVLLLSDKKPPHLTFKIEWGGNNLYGLVASSFRLFLEATLQHQGIHK